MKYWILLSVTLFAFFAVACEDKPTVSLDDRDAGEATKEVEKTPEPAKTNTDAPKEKEKALPPTKEETEKAKAKGKAK